MRIYRLLIAAITAITVGSCGGSDKSGACNGQMDGTYFRLQIVNYNLTPTEIQVNGRSIATVPAARPSLVVGSDAVIPSVRALGEFPNCVGTRIDGGQVRLGRDAELRTHGLGHAHNVVDGQTRSAGRGQPPAGTPDPVLASCRPGWRSGRALPVRR